MDLNEKSLIHKCIPIVFAFLIVIILLPNGIRMPNRDSGAFLYIGQRILEGDIPYRDMWDHKPPVIFFINALGLFIARGSPWGVWLLELLALFSAALLSFHLLKRAFSTFPALIASLAWVTALIPLLAFHGPETNGNFPEIYALPLQFASLYLFLIADEKTNYSWPGPLIGIMFAITLLLKHNLIAIWVSIGLYLLYCRAINRHWRTLAIDLGLMLLGVVSIVLLVIVYFSIHSSLTLFWDAAFKYNFAYSSTSILTRIKAFLFGIEMFSAISPLVLASWGAALFYLYYFRNQSKNERRLLIISIIGLPLEFILASMTGRTYRHYFVAWLPLISILLAFFISFFLNLSGQNISGDSMYSCRPRFNNTKFVKMWFFFMLLTINILPLWSLFSSYRSSHGTLASLLKIPHQTAAEYIGEITSKNDYVLIWGAEGYINFLAQRRSPSRFFYQFPFTTVNYTTPQIVDEFVDDVEAKKPRIIIDTKERSLGPIDLNERQKWIPRRKTQSGIILSRLPKNIDRFFDFVSSNYIVDKQIGSWRVYIYDSNSS